jgi:N-methylhydantoinase A/oxoprolinase/acetone carboxylase beta subunit
MAEAMRLVSIGRGIDPRGYILLPLGGAGPIHAAALAAELGIRRILVPPHPGVLSAAGLLGAPIEHEVAAAYPQPLADARWDALRAVFARLDETCAELMRQEGVAPAAPGTVAIRYAADVCYSGQGYHLEVPLDATDPDPLARLYREFLIAHDRVYGHATEAPARLVNLRAIHRVEAGAAVPWPTPVAQPVAKKRDRPVLIEAASGFEITSIYDRAALAAGATIDGPAIIEQSDTTTLVPRGWCCRAGESARLLIEMRKEAL